MAAWPLSDDFLETLRTCDYRRGFSNHQDMTIFRSLNDQLSHDPFGPREPLSHKLGRDDRDKFNELLALGEEHDDLKQRLLRAHWIRQRCPWKAEASPEEACDEIVAQLGLVPEMENAKFEDVHYYVTLLDMFNQFWDSAEMEAAVAAAVKLVSDAFRAREEGRYMSFWSCLPPPFCTDSSKLEAAVDDLNAICEEMIKVFHMTQGETFAEAKAAAAAVVRKRNRDQFEEDNGPAHD